MSDKRHPLFWATVGYVFASRLWIDGARARMMAKAEDTEGTMQKALAKTVSVTHSSVWWACVCYLCSLEYARLYCSDQTIVGHYLGKFAQFLSSKEKYRMARRVMMFVVRWNEFWLGKCKRCVLF
jgi:hypothetical protein